LATEGTSNTFALVPREREPPEIIVTACPVNFTNLSYLAMEAKPAVDELTETTNNTTVLETDSVEYAGGWRLHVITARYGIVTPKRSQSYY
jgi:hypothetical protein